MNHQRLLHFLLASLALPVLSPAQVTMTALTSFAGDGWLQPGEVSWLSTTAANERSIAYSPVPNHLYVASRTGGSFIRILDGTTGAEVNAGNNGVTMTGVTGGTFAISSVAVAGDGVLYGCNLVSPTVTVANPFKIYRWDDIGSAPAVAVTTGTITLGRMGDTLDAIGSGAETLLVAGEGATPNPTTTPGGYAIFSTNDGTNFTGSLVTFPPPVPPAAPVPANGAFRAGLTFTDADSVIGSQGTGGFHFTSYSGTTGTHEQSKVLSTVLERPMDFLVLGGKPLLATLETNGNSPIPPAETFSTVRVYDLTIPATPALVASGRTATSYTAQGTSGPGTGSVRWGNVTGNSATLYAISALNGIQAFTVTMPVTEPPPMVFSTINLNAAAGTLTVAWNSVTGATYRVEASSNLVDWVPVASAIPADASGTNTFVWTIPAQFTSRAQLRVIKE